MDNISTSLLNWYDQEQRELPWRGIDDPYAIWVSEIMLQQTQVATVVEYYRRWMQEFPTIQSLANASSDQVLALWQGLGYYGRVRRLQAAARMVCDELSGAIPTSASALMQLPGIGPYTSAAIASIAFGEPAAAVDGNVIRVISRLYDIADDISRAAGKKKVFSVAQQLLSSKRPGDHNQAMMELGATICTPSSPKCTICPLMDKCLAFEHNTIALRPVKPTRKKPPHRHLAAAYCARAGQLLLVRRPSTGLLGGLWELPNCEPSPNQSDVECLTVRLQNALGLQAQVVAQVASVRHAYTHFTVDVSVYRCETSGAPRLDGIWDRIALVTANEQDTIGITGVTTKILRQVGWPDAN